MAFDDECFGWVLLLNLGVLCKLGVICLLG